MSVPAEVQITSCPATVPISGSPSAYNVSTRYADSSSALGSGATFTGTGRDSGAAVTSQYSKIRALAASDQSGNLYLEQSPDNSTWYTTKTIALTGGTPVTLEDGLIQRYWRVRYVNGGTAQGSFRLDSAMIGI
jgi:hypothetical protein